jgi:CBS domain-containing protein
MRELMAKDVMNPEVLSVSVDMPVSEFAAFLVEHEISGAPVEDRKGNLVGVASLTDLAAAAALDRSGVEHDRSRADFFVSGWEERLEPEELQRFHVTASDGVVADIMTPAVFSVREETPVPDIAATMLDGHIHRVLVTRENQLVGIVSTTDLLGLLVEK